MKPHRGIWLALLFVLAAIPARAMDLTDVFDLLDAGVGETVILEQMEAEGASFLLETDDILALRRSGASDRLLRAMIESGDTRRTEREARLRAEEEANAYGADAYRTDGDWTEDYYAPDRELRIRISYDPFGYHWYASPSYFVYYYPFRTWDVGFYYAGWHHYRWWGWNGYWSSYYRDYCDSYYWRHHHRPYYAHHDYRDNVRYRSRYDRTADGKSRDLRSRTGVDRRESVTRSRDSRADIRRSRSRTESPATRDRNVDRSRDNTRSRNEVRAPRSTGSDRSTPSRPSRSERSRSSTRSSGERSGGRSR